jgi:transcriptional regulator with XRE-family HTH domain
MSTHPDDPIIGNLLDSEEGRRLYKQEELLTRVAVQLDRMLEEAGVSRTELATRLNVTKGSVSQVLAGNRNLTLRKLSDLFFALGYSVAVVPAPLAADTHSIRDATLNLRKTDSLPSRDVAGFNGAPGDHRILDAWWKRDELIVMSQHFARLRLSLDQLRELRFFKKSSRKELERFQIDEDGAYVRWPRLDVDLDWNGFCRLAGRVDAGRQQRSQESREAFGDAIRRLREEHGLRQQDIEGLDERHVRRIEKGEVPPTASALKKLADSHMMTVREYLDELAGSIETE